MQLGAGTVWPALRYHRATCQRADQQLYPIVRRAVRCSTMLSWCVWGNVVWKGAGSGSRSWDVHVQGLARLLGESTKPGGIVDDKVMCASGRLPVMCACSQW